MTEFVNSHNIRSTFLVCRSSINGNWIVAQEVKPVVDQMAWNCTLYKIDINNNKEAKIYHVQSGQIIRIPNDGSTRTMFMSIDPNVKTEALSSIVDYDTLVVLPKYVAFKGPNGFFLENDHQDILKGLCPSFTGSDIGAPIIANEIQNTSDGQTCVKFLQDDKFWTCGGDESLIYAVNVDAPQGFSRIFDVIKIDKNLVALRSHSNNKFCMKGDLRFPGAPFYFPDRYLAVADGVTKDTYLEVVEPLFRRTVTTYNFDIKNARIYNVSLLYADEHIWDNYTDVRHTGSANGTISATKSRTYTNNVTVSGTVATTFETGVPFIAKGQIQVSLTTTYSHEWSKTEEMTQEVGDTFTVTVEPMKKTIARGVATMGTCDVPFSYIQKDYPTSGGPPIITRLSDGVFTGANAYNFYAEVHYEELPPQGFVYQAPTKIIKRSAL